MTDPTDPAPPATKPAKTPEEYDREWDELAAIVYEMRIYAPNKLHGAVLLLRSMMNATEDSK